VILLKAHRHNDQRFNLLTPYQIALRVLAIFQRRQRRPTGLQLGSTTQQIAHGSNNFQPLPARLHSGSNNTFGSTSAVASRFLRVLHQSQQHDTPVEPSPVPAVTPSGALTSPGGTPRWSSHQSRQYDHTQWSSHQSVRPHPVELSPVPAVTTQWSSHQSRQ